MWVQLQSASRPPEGQAGKLSWMSGGAAILAAARGAPAALALVQTLACLLASRRDKGGHGTAARTAVHQNCNTRMQRHGGWGWRGVCVFGGVGGGARARLLGMPGCMPAGKRGGGVGEGGGRRAGEGGGGWDGPSPAQQFAVDSMNQSVGNRCSASQQRKNKVALPSQQEGGLPAHVHSIFLFAPKRRRHQLRPASRAFYQ